MRLGTDGEFVHAVDKGGPWERGLLLAEKCVELQLAARGGGAVVEEEADVDVCGRGKRGRGAVGEDFEGHG